MPSRGANLDASSSTPLTRRHLREQREAEKRAEAQQRAESEREQRGAERAPVPVVTTEIVVVKPAEPAPLTRRQVREREQLERQRQLELQAEELATLEIAEIGSAPLEPAVELALEPVEAESEFDGLATTEIPMHVAATYTPRARSLALSRDTHDARAAALAEATPSAHALALPAAAARSRRFAKRSAGAPRSRRSAWAKTGLSGVAMAFVLGITAVTAIPSTVSASPVDVNVVNLSLNANSAPATQQLITAGASSSEVVDRDGYGVTDAGELQAAGYSTAQLLVGRSLAQELVNAMDAGKLVGSTPDHLKEIRWIAQGVTVADCGVDYRILEIIAIAVRNFDQVGVSDINRKCTGQIEGAGSSSSHYIDGGGHAVDFYLLNNQSLNGSDVNTLRMITLLDPVMPVGARVGQAGCRASAGVSVHLTNWTEFDDTCTHMHVDVPVTDAPLLLTDADAPVLASQ
ncbi:hypothetical protein [Herbiconiux daphne]|uniref:Uncharacterized protein n=1 Tax=Herbiconiux daphne TaxID=2970914 RepID=A0ABT2H3T6_9MICO|nr:hypothetical protein [Herbiconiux daphne]MCS5734596.1 hypothetical protein [Herbiconiux daphne]